MLGRQTTRRRRCAALSPTSILTSSPSARRGTSVPSRRCYSSRLQLHRHYSSPPSAVHRLPSAVCTAASAFDVGSSGLFCRVVSTFSQSESSCKVSQFVKRCWAPNIITHQYGYPVYIQLKGPAERVSYIFFAVVMGVVVYLI